MLITEFSLIHKMQSGYGAHRQLYQPATKGELTLLIRLPENKNFKS
jgi:hypothetical protein